MPPKRSTRPSKASSPDEVEIDHVDTEITETPHRDTPKSGRNTRSSSRLSSAKKQSVEEEMISIPVKSTSNSTFKKRKSFPEPVKKGNHVVFDSDEEFVNEIESVEQVESKKTPTKTNSGKSTPKSTKKSSRKSQESDDDVIQYSSSESEQEEEPEIVSISTTKQEALDKAKTKREEEARKKKEKRELNLKRKAEEELESESKIQKLPEDLLEQAAETLDNIEPVQLPKARVGAIQKEKVNKKINFDTATLDDLADMGFLDDMEEKVEKKEEKKIGYKHAKQVDNFVVVPVNKSLGPRISSQSAMEFQAQRFESVRRSDGKLGALNSMTSFRKRGMGPAMAFRRN